MVDMPSDVKKTAEQVANALWLTTTQKFDAAKLIARAILTEREASVGRIAALEAKLAYWQSQHDERTRQLGISALEATPPAQGYSQEAPNYNPDAHVIAGSQAEPKATETGGSLFGNCDARGAKELFARLVNAVERRGAAAGAGDGVVYALYNSIASSSADRLVSDYANTINAALTAAQESGQ